MSQHVNRRWKRITAVATLTVGRVGDCLRHSPDRTTSISVYAASSLIKSFTAIGKDFEATNPGYTVEFVFAGSRSCPTAVADGADVDVFASANTADMTAVADAGVASGAPVPFAANRLVLVAPAGNPGHVVSLADLARPGPRVAVCGAQGGCGVSNRARPAPSRRSIAPRAVGADVEGRPQRRDGRESRRRRRLQDGRAEAAGDKRLDCRTSRRRGRRHVVDHGDQRHGFGRGSRPSSFRRSPAPEAGGFWRRTASPSR